MPVGIPGRSGGPGSGQLVEAERGGVARRRCTEIEERERTVGLGDRFRGRRGAPSEDNVLLFGVQRAGKTSTVVVPTLLGWKAPVHVLSLSRLQSDPDEARRFLVAIKGHRLAALYTVALTMGLRQGEALGLRWQDVDLDMGYIRIAKQLQRVNGAFELVELKRREAAGLS